MLFNFFQSFVDGETLKFFGIQNFYHDFYKKKRVCCGIIQYRRRLTPNRARLYFLNNGITVVYPRSTGKFIAQLLCKMKKNEIEEMECFTVESGKLSLGGGHHDYRFILNEAYDTYLDYLRTSRIKRLDHKIGNLILYTLINVK